MHNTQEQWVQQAIEALKNLNSGDPGTRPLATYLYTADRGLTECLEQLKEFLELENPAHSERQTAGYLLEQIALLAFRGLKGFTSIKSFQSAGPQIDLLISGDETHWLYVCKLLYLDINQRGIVVEAKATAGPLKDNQFARLCSIMELNLFKSVGLGVFFTIKGVSGFPQRGNSRQRKISDSRLRQVLFHAKTQKAIVVLDKDDILELNRNGSLILMLERKIRDLSELSGLPTPSYEQCKEIDLPDHLKHL